MTFLERDEKTNLHKKLTLIHNITHHYIHKNMHKYTNGLIMHIQRCINYETETSIHTAIWNLDLHTDKSEDSQSVYIHCRYTILAHLFHFPFSLSLFQSPSFSNPVSLIYHSLSYPPHRLNSLEWKERKGGKEIEREMRRVWERERDRLGI